MADSHREEIAKLETLYANNPEGRVFTHLAEAYRKAGELERAREILEDGLRRHSDYSSAHVVLGRVLADQGLPDDASAAFRRVLELDRHNLVALRSLGEIASETGRTVEALLYYRELLSLDPSDERLRGTVRGLEERRDAEAASPLPAPVEEAPGFAEPTGEPPALVSDEASRDDASAADLYVGPAVPFVPDVTTEEPPADAQAEEAGWTGHVPLETEPASGNWEEDVGIELEAMPGDLGALADELPAEASVADDDGSAAATGEDWAVSSEWLGQPPTDPLASGLDLGIEGEEVGRFELPVSDLDLTEPLGDQSAPFDVPGGGLDLPGPDEPTPFDLGGTTETEEAPAEATFEPVGGTGGFDIDVGPATPEFGGPSPEDASAAAPEPTTEPESSPADGELVTETMAELYFAQGFYGRAAEVYRSLLRNRPDDARLQQRLGEAESMSGWPRADEPAAGEPGEAWLEGVESAWTGGRGVAGGEATPYAWAEPSAAEAPAGPRVGEYFRSLLAWRPGGAADMPPYAADEPAVERAGDEPAEPEGQMAYGAAETEAPAYLPLDAVEEQVGGGAEHATPEPWDAPEPVRPPELPEAVSAAGAEEEGADDDEDLEMFRSWLQSLRK